MARQFTCTPDYPVVETDAGKVRGFVLDGIFTFYGIRYARAKRFQAPEPPEKWEGIKDATSYGCTAPTYGDPVPSGEILIPHRYWPENEDCLNLNVWTKSIEKDAKKPVVVWFHGGGYSDGSSLEQVAYEGDALAEYGDVVVVTVNHRLNILGFLDMSSFGEKYANSCNAGIADLVASLQWVHNNIAGFGGDPERVLIFGQSGGGGKVCTLLQTPAADGLFQRAVMMSGGAGARENSAEHRPVILEMLKILDIKEENIEELETVPYTVLMKAYNRACSRLQTVLSWNPRPNGWYAGHPLLAGFREHALKVPTIVTTVIGEFSAFAGQGYKGLEGDELLAKLNERYQGHGEELISAFRAAYPEKALSVIPQVNVRDSVLSFMDARAAAKPEAPGYNAVFSLEFPVNGGMPSWHCADIPFVFHNTYRVPCCNIDGVTEKLEEETAGALVAFARTGDPNHENMPVWEAYTGDNRATMFFDRESSCGADRDRKLTELLGEYGPKFNLFAPRIPKDDGETGRAWLY